MLPRRELHSEATSGRFRKDLLEQISNFHIRLPALNQRPQDIPVLVRHFLEKYGTAHEKEIHGLTRRTQIAIAHHDWQGNVRELENAILTAVLAADTNFIDIRNLPEHLQQLQHKAPPWMKDGPVLLLDEVRALHIERVLALCDGNRVRAAQLLGIGRTSLYRFLKSKRKDLAQVNPN